MSHIENRFCTYLAIIIILVTFASHGLCGSILEEGVGYGPILLEKSTPQDLRKHFGPEDDIERTKVATSNNYIYRKLGLKFNINKSGRVNTIMTLPNFTGSTLKGISLSSSLIDIEKKYGKNPEVHPKKTKDTAMVWAYPESGVIFWFKKSLVSKRKIKFITITSLFERP